MASTPEEKTWYVPEIVSFIARITNILAMSCILMPDSEERTWSELLFVLACAFVFYLNCLEFIGPPKENLMVQLSAAAVGFAAIVFLLMNTDSKTDGLYRGKYYASIFGGISIACSGISGSDFYIHSTIQ